MKNPSLITLVISSPPIIVVMELIRVNVLPTTFHASTLLNPHVII